MCASLADVKLHRVETWSDGEDLLTWLGTRRDFLGVDIETTGLSVGKDRIRLVQFGDATAGWALDYEDWKGLIKEVIGRYDRPMVAHNLIFDSRFLKKAGIDLPPHLMHDTMVMAHLLDPRYSVSLKNLAARHIDKRARMGQNALSEAFHKGGWNFETVPTSLESYWVYSAMDTVLTAMLAEKFWPRVKSEFRQIYDVEMGCLHVLRNAGVRGMRVDVPYLEEKTVEYNLQLEELRSMVPVAPSKDQDVVAALLAEGVKLEHTTEKGDKLSVEDDVLAWVELQYPHVTWVHPLREWRKKKRVVNAYFENLLEMNTDGIVHPHVRVVGAKTGRMSVTEPALQTLPRGRAVRDAFISREGHSLILADYKQCELRVLASEANEEAMLDAIRRGENLHRWVGAEVYDCEQDQLSPQQYAATKNTQFARLYGAGAAKIALTASQSGEVIHVEAIEDFLRKYNQLFPGVTEFMNTTVREVMETQFEGDKRMGYVYTVLGRRIPVSKEKAYVGVNAKIQSSATADLLKLKLIELDAAGLGDNILLPVHDEIVMEAPDEDLDEVLRTIEEVMPETKLFRCPIDIDVSTTKRWGDKYPDDNESLPLPLTPGAADAYKGGNGGNARHNQETLDRCDKGG